MGRLMNMVATLRRNDKYSNDKAFMRQYRALRNALAPLFLPLVRSLAAADLLVLSLNIQDEDIEHYCWVTGRPSNVVLDDRERIWIDARCDGGI